jgi:predicted DNA-binding transcriptional regulator YafY
MKHDMLRRFAFIEARLLWAGGLTASELADAFGIARQNAQQTIKAYAEQHSGQMRYDPAQRRQVPEDSFTVNYIRDDVGRFLDYQRAVSHTAHFFDEPDWADLPFTDADALIHPLYDRDAARTVLTALRQQTVVVVGYWAMTGARTRRISPHHLVYADSSYHLRAWCHETDRYLDFALARIVTAEPCDEPWVSGDGDREWHERVDLEFEINPALPAETKAALRADHIKTGEPTLRVPGVRVAVAFYVRRRFERIDARYGMPLWR